METVDLEVKIRPEISKADLRRVRRVGAIPAVAYAEGNDAVQLEIDEHHYTIQTAGKPVTQIYSLVGEGEAIKDKLALVKAIQKEPIKQRVQHVDFYVVTAGTKISVTVPIRLTGECAAVKAGGVILNQTTYDLEVECLPRQIPEALEIEISNLEEGQSISLADITLPEGVTFAADPAISIVSALAKRVEEEPVAAEGEEAGEEGADAAAEGKEGAPADGAAAPKKDGE